MVLPPPLSLDCQNFVGVFASDVSAWGLGFDLLFPQNHVSNCCVVVWELSRCRFGVGTKKYIHLRMVENKCAAWKYCMHGEQEDMGRQTKVKG